MAPKAMSFKANSVIYFRGDLSEKIFILKTGKVCLSSQDIETGLEVRELIQTGEFFGVKSALGRYPREESALVLGDTDVLQFSVPEFEQFVSTNTRVIMKMMKVFSNQLRRIHGRVNSLLNIDEKGDPEKGLITIGEYYLKKRMYAQALHVFRRYLTYYPSGKFADMATRNSKTAEQYAQKYGSGKGPAAPVSAPAQSAAAPRAGASSGSADEAAKMYYNAVSIFSQNNYMEALKEFKKVAELGLDEEYTVKSMFELGRCLFHLKQYDQCIKHFTGLIQRYPKMPDLAETLYYTGQCYEAKNDKDRAVGFYKKIFSMSTEDDPVRRKVMKALRALEESRA
ncbi:MAG: tetratricopeptide repeat protein [Spirochaetales bacterium]|jgi:TolA-binding protein|nr:tetratricopeptide repeat protein [Spirochaetales bacterium]